MYNMHPSSMKLSIRNIGSTTQLTCSYNAQLMRLCKKGKLNDAFVLIDQMTENKVRFSHHNVSALLHGCIQSNQPAQYRSIWKQFVDNRNIKPNYITYSLAISAASRCNDLKTVQTLAIEMRRNHLHQMTSQTWNQLIDSFGRINQINLMFDAYHQMQQSNCVPDSCTISCLLHGCIKNKRFDKFEMVFKDIISSPQNIKQCVDTYVLVCIIDGITKSGKPHLIENIWNMVRKYDIQPNVNCYGAAVLAASKANNETLVDQLVQNMKHNLIQKMTYHQCWNQILKAYCNLRNYDTMWNEYEEMTKNIHPDLITLSIITSVQSKKYQIKALCESKKYICNWNDLTHKELKGFYRVAMMVEDTELLNVLHPILEATQKNIDVVAELQINSKEMCFDNFYKHEDSNVLKKVDDLIQETGHKVDISVHSEVITTGTNALSIHRLISYHAEKKALAAYLLHSNDELDQDIRIKLNLRMCMDCHRFFDVVSKLHTNRQIIVTDPKTTHKFINGACCCGVACG
eukprot:248331_1